MKLSELTKFYNMPPPTDLGSENKFWVILVEKTLKPATMSAIWWAQDTEILIKKIYQMSSLQSKTCQLSAILKKLLLILSY